MYNYIILQLRNDYIGLSTAPGSSHKLLPFSDRSLNSGQDNCIWSSQENHNHKLCFVNFCIILHVQV